MQHTRTISTVEVHTGGEPFRIVTSGLPRLPGNSIVERRAWVHENADEIRQALMFQPRGHADMYGGSATAPDYAPPDFRRPLLPNPAVNPPLSPCGNCFVAPS